MNVAEYGDAILLDIATATNKLSRGVLMDPDEVARAVSPREPDVVSGNWWLCGTLHPGMFAAIAKSPVRHLGKVIVTAGGTRYLVLAQQVGRWQHRFMLQVAGRQMQQFIRACMDRGFEMSLGHAQEDESFLIQDCQFAHPLLGDCLTAVAPQMGAQELRQEACSVAAVLLTPGEVGVEELPAAQHVCVTIVASSDLADAVTGGWHSEEIRPV